MGAADAAKRMSLIFAACGSLVGGGLLVREGWVLRGVNDPVVGAKLPTACAGVTEGVVLGKGYTPEQCEQMTMEALFKRAGPLVACLPPKEPFPTAAFMGEQLDVSFNIKGGPATYLKSSMCRKVRERDYRGACEAILEYRYAGGQDCSAPGNRTCRGVWLRRLESRDKCLKAIQ